MIFLHILSIDDDPERLELIGWFFAIILGHPTSKSHGIVMLELAQEGSATNVANQL